MALEAKKDLKPELESKPEMQMQYLIQIIKDERENLERLTSVMQTLENICNKNGGITNEYDHDDTKNIHILKLSRSASKKNTRTRCDNNQKLLFKIAIVLAIITVILYMV